MQDQPLLVAEEKRINLHTGWWGGGTTLERINLHWYVETGLTSTGCRGKKDQPQLAYGEEEHPFSRGLGKNLPPMEGWEMDQPPLEGWEIDQPLLEGWEMDQPPLEG